MFPNYYDWFDVSCILIFVTMFLALSVFWLLVLGDCLRNKDLKLPQKVGWLALITVTHILGGLLFYREFQLSGKKYTIALRAVVSSVILFVMMAFLLSQRH
jgi:hypothetical protein